MNVIISEAYLKGASEVFLESIPSSEEGCVWFLMDGEFREYMTVPDDIADDIINRIKTMANLEGADKNLQKIGHIKFKRDGLPEFPLAVAIYPADGQGEKVALKIHAPR